ncbi:FAD-dependent oxidoreductase [Halomonas sp. ZH2S]|uniref:FAD-dependent oxidoreductase n=1 Tax=Vreelandella zhuhanensis TaxID=2684210 RepID=A0A7X3H126_9GAMM|nr:FAD-binding oxidoreductase [Halomonas zhuhanensis]MWJ28239.1 FAD-dependent oxidoreductase [Halomonas zhuhanensis]
MSRQTVVLGAGMVGVSIAWHLVQRGHDVTLVDRLKPGRETSFGNAGIIQREAVRPYPFPRDLKTLLKVVPNRRVDIRYRPGGMLQAASPLLRYWLNSAPAIYKKIVPEYASLIQLSLQEHAPMIEAAGAEALVCKDGWLELYRTPSKLNKRLKEAEEARGRFGVQFELLDGLALAVKEPDLSEDIIGAIHWLDPWTVADPGALVEAYAQAFQKAGGELLQADLQEVTQQEQGWVVHTSEGDLEADTLVVALGPWAGSWLKGLGYDFPTFVKRGYHMHYGLAPKAKLHHWVMDAEVGYLLAPMHAGVRLTTGAELDRLEAPAHESQLKAAETMARKLFPLGERCDQTAWKGARPCLPDMKPVIGPAPRHKGLWLAFGHGHQGFTLGPATGRLLADMIEGDTPPIDMAPFRAERFR